MNEALLAEAACDYEDGMDLITADLTTRAVEQGGCTRGGREGADDRGVRARP